MQCQDTICPGHPAISLPQVIEAAERLVGSCVPINLLQHGLKAPLKGPDGSWIIVQDPDSVAHAIEKVAQGRPINIGALLAPKCDSRLLVVDVDGTGAWPKLRELGLSSSGAFWVSLTGRRRHHIFGYCEGPPPQREIRAGGLPVDLLSHGYAIVPPSNTYREAKGGGPYRWVEGHSPTDIPLAELDPLPLALVDWWLNLRQGPTDPGVIGPDRNVPLGKRALYFVAHGAPLGKQRMEAVAAARNYLSAGFTVEHTTAALWRGFQVCQQIPENPWTFEDALAIVNDLAQRPAPALEVRAKRGPVFVQFVEEADNG